ncbi:signal peptidase II [Mycoplasma leonicaptivi]|uniref:signal peptidase II n=1 Tax=Mycoplasma leonicaptivi TaxID=36742 RepID=UPI0004860D92|nr:signal peptidase II [Mycoplasma leonicaptivi]
MELSKKSLINYLDKLKKHLLINKKKIILSYIMFFVTFIIFFTIDQLTKNILFVHGDIKTLKEGFNGHLYVFLPDNRELLVESIWEDTIKNYSIIGIRSIWHGSTTFLSTRNTNTIQSISIIFLILLPFFILIPSKHFLWQSFFIGLILSGNAGNMTDRFFFAGYVKDIFYFPFFKSSGTFNFADVAIILGITGMVILSITGYFIGQNKTKNINHLVI